MSLIGIPVGFYGYLFPGNINIMVLDLFVSKRYRLLAVMLLLIVVFESIYCLCTLLLVSNINVKSLWYTWLQAGSFIMVFALGLWMLLERKNDKQLVQKNTFYRGIINIIIHPQQIPFWLIIGILINPFKTPGVHVLTITNFIVLNAVGTLLALGLYMFFGDKILKYFNLNLITINRAMGLVYMAFGCYSFLSYIIGFPK